MKDRKVETAFEGWVRLLTVSAQPTSPLYKTCQLLDGNRRQSQYRFVHLLLSLRLRHLCSNQILCLSVFRVYTMFKRALAEFSILDPEAQRPRTILLGSTLLSTVLFRTGTSLYHTHFSHILTDSFRQWPEGMAMASVTLALSSG